MEEIKKSVGLAYLGYRKEPMDGFYGHRLGGFFPRLRVKRIIHELGETEGKLILDVGCEAGYISICMAEGGGWVVPMDLCKPALLKLKEKIGGSERLKINGPILGVAHLLPLKSNSVDSIVCSEVIQMTPFVESILGEFSRVLKDDGKMILTFPNEKIKRFLYPFSRLIGIETGFQRELTPFHYSLEEIEKFVGNSFKIVESYRMPSPLFPLTNVVVCQKG